MLTSEIRHIGVPERNSTILSADSHRRSDIGFDLASDDEANTIVFSTNDFRIRLADTEVGRNSASMLVNKMYSWRGYPGLHKIKDNPNQITLAASMKDTLVGTITLSIDSAAGLMADEIFKAEVDKHRGPGSKLCELTKLAFDADADSPFPLAALFHICFIYARRIHHCTDAFIEVNPRHRRYYERMLGFKQEGELKMNPRVSAPAYLLCLQLDHMEEQILKHGGTSDHPELTRSLYPYFFSPREEAGITQRLISNY